MPLSQVHVVELRSLPLGDSTNRVGRAIVLGKTTKAVIARSTGLPYSYVADVAAGRFQTITVDNARKFAKFFGCLIEDLFPSREESERLHERSLPFVQEAAR